MSPLGWAATLVMFLCIFLIPLGWPGLWLMVAVVGAGTLLGHVGGGILITVLAIAAVAEFLEFVIVKRYSERYGGSNRAFWGAVLGGTVGVIVGFPVPVLGPVIAGVIGSFVGAAAVSLYESRDLGAASRVGWGVVIARTVAAFVKVGAAIVVLVIGGTAWIVG